MNLKFRKPSSGTTIATIALFVALSSTAYAASLPKNSVGNKQLKKNAVTAAKIKSSSVASSDVKNDSLTGGDINESTLGPVPSATNAQTAQSAQSAQSVNGSQIVKLNYRGEEGAALTEVFNAGGLILRASCIGGDVGLEAKSTSQDAVLHASITTLAQVTTVDEGFATAYKEDDSFDSGDTFNLVTGGNLPAGILEDSTQGTLTYTNAAGSVVTLTYMAEEETDMLGGNADCIVIGNASVS